MDLFKSDYTFEQVAGELGVPPELLDFKCRLMTHKGYEGINVPIYAKSNFLKDVEIGYESDGEC